MGKRKKVRVNSRHGHRPAPERKQKPPIALIVVLLIAVIGLGCAAYVVSNRPPAQGDQPEQVGDTGEKPTPPEATPTVVENKAAPPAEEANASVAAALVAVTKQCPESYPDSVTQLPMGDGYTGESTEDLLGMLKHWNPVIRKAVSGELAQRGDKGLPPLRQALKSDNWRVRAGAAEAIASIINHLVRNWKESFPNETNYRIGQENVRKKYASLAAECLSLLKDERREIRAAALGVANVLMPKDKAYQEAVLAMCYDEDEYLAQSAQMSLRRNIGIDKLDTDVLVAGLSKAMKQPLPRGKGDVVTLIGTLDPAAQRQFIPALLAHIDWVPDRDTMFGGGGQATAVKLLVKLQVKELIPRIPKLLTKSMRGAHMLYPACEALTAFGSQAKSILPQLKEEEAKLAQKEEELRKHKNSSRGYYRNKYAETKKQYDTLVKAIKNVEK